MLNTSNLITTIVVALALTACSSDDSTAVLNNQLYTQTNETQNKIVHLKRSDDGSINIVNTALTGGRGTDGFRFDTNNGAGGQAADSLVSQGSIVISTDKTRLFAVNGGDNSISSFSINQDNGDLIFLTKTSVTTNSSVPNALTFYNNKLYVSFRDGTNRLNAYNVSSNGTLSQIGTYSLPANGANQARPTQLSIAPSGGYLLVIGGPGSGQMLTYPINHDGTLGQYTQTTTPFVNPFAGTFVGNQFAATDINRNPNEAGSLGLYNVANSQTGGALSLSGTQVVNGQAASCWVVATPNGKYIYVGNGGGAGSISLYSVNSAATTKSISLVSSAAAVHVGVAGDMWVSPDNKYLYVAWFAEDRVRSYQINEDGTLKGIGNVLVGSSNAAYTNPTPTNGQKGNSLMGLVGI
jgi:6-phosphogluconolactonase